MFLAILSVKSGLSIVITISGLRFNTDFVTFLIILFIFKILGITSIIPITLISLI